MGFAATPSIPQSSTQAAFRTPSEEKATTVVVTKGIYPSNADIVWKGKRVNAQVASQIGQFWTGDLFKESGLPSTPAPNGHYILDPWLLNRNEVSGLSIDNDITRARPSTVAFYAGRAWWSGVKDEKYVGTLFFSQLLTDDTKIGKCYQENDPTSEELNALLDTDGGVIPIPECGHVLKLLAVNDVLIVFASNGIWSVGSDSGFSATNYATRKISKIGVISPESVVEAEDFVFFWSDSGIYRLSPDSITGYLSPQNITIDTIQSFYNSLSAVAKFQVFGMYDNTEKRVWWYYNPFTEAELVTGGEGGIEGAYPTRYTNALVFDLFLSAFSVQEFGDTDVQYVTGAAMSATNTRANEAQQICVGSDTVVVGVDDVVVSLLIPVAAQQTQKVLAVNLDPLNPGIAFADYSSLDFMEFDGWPDEVTYSSYLETGYEINGTTTNDSQFIYVIPVFNRTEKTYTVTNVVGDPPTIPVWSWDNESACTMFAKWDWTSSIASKKWSSEEEAYRLIDPFTPTASIGQFSYTGGQEVVNNKLRVRGQGTSLQLRFESQDGKDMQLLGWQYYGEQTTSP